MKKIKRNSPRKPRASGLSHISEKASIDDRLSHASMLLEYVFKHGIDWRRRIINLTGEIDDDKYELIDQAMTVMEGESRKAITIKINSPGGFTYQALAIVGRLKESKCKIICKGYGEIMSAATVILACADERKVSRYATFMWHEASYGIEDRHSMARDTVYQSDKENVQWAELMAQFSHRDAQFWLDMGDRRDTYYTAEELLELGVADVLF